MLAVLFVDTNSDTHVDGRTTLREAIGQANFSSPGHDTITFSTNPAHALNGATIHLTEGQLFIDEDVTIDATMLPAGLTIDAGNGTDLMPNTGDGSRIFNVTNLFPVGPTVINSLTLTGGDPEIGSGGAIFSQADLTIKNSVITGNATTMKGGGVYVNGANLDISATTFRQNYSALWGGGLYSKITNGSIKIDKSTFDSNHFNYTDFGVPFIHPSGAGAQVQSNNSTVTITNSIFRNNQATGHGANEGGLSIIANESPNVLLDRLQIIDNRSDDDFAGLGIENSGSTIQLTNSSITNNKGSDNDGSFDGGGGGLFLSTVNNGRTTVASSTIANNETVLVAGGTSNPSAGGCLIEAASGTTTTFVNCTISGNQALGQGGGVMIGTEQTGGSVKFQNCTITGNLANSDHDGIGAGGGIHVGNSGTVVTIENTIVAGNSRGLPVTGTTRDDINGAVTASWSLIGDGSGATITNNGGNQIGNSTTPIDPKLGPLVYNGGPVFLDGSRMLTHTPLPTSPALDAGDPTITNAMLANDQRGAPFARVVDGPDANITARIDIGAIEWQAHLPAGDYNRNGVVDAADYTVWRDTLGSSTDLRADGDGNGVVNMTDYITWTNAFGSGTGSVLADSSGNGATDIADYYLWASTYGSTTDLRCDCNEDGIVDDGDFDIWFDTFGSTLEIAQFGLLSSMFDPDAPPSVVGFAVSLPGDVTVDFADRVGSGDQIRSVPLTAANTLSITFSQDVVVTQSDLTVTNLDGTSPTVSSFVYDSAAQTATWTFAAALANGRYVVRLSDAVENLDGKALDGEFFNPTRITDSQSAVFPSGDGDAGGEFRFRFTVLFGDTDHDNVFYATDYQNWQSTEPGMIIVSTTADDFDTDLSFGDVSLREAVNYANTASAPTTIQVPAGRYTLSRIGTESTASVALNDLNILAEMTIVGAGPGLTIIDNSGLVSAPSTRARAFDLASAASRLRLSRLTVANGSSQAMAQAAQVASGATLEIIDSTIVNHTASTGAAAVLVSGAHVVVSRSVFTNNDDTSIYGGTAILVSGSTSAPASIEVGESIFALNTQPTYSGGTAHVAIWITGTATKTNKGKNLYDNAGGGFFDTTPGTGDYLGTPNYVVTSVADTFNHADDLEALSAREAVDLANAATGTQEIWLPAWHFTLTLDRGTHASDTDVAYGDLDVKDSLKIRGVAGRTSIDWKAGVIDKVFELAGDFNNDGQADYGSVSSADYTMWQDQNGHSGTLEQFSADGDDDGDVDAADYTIWSANFGHTLGLFDIGE